VLRNDLFRRSELILGSKMCQLAPKIPPISNLSKRAMLAKSSDSENIDFLVSYDVLGAPGLPKDPQDSQETFRDGSKQPPRPSHEDTYFGDLLFSKSEARNRPKYKPSNCKNTFETAIFGPQLTWAPECPQSWRPGSAKSGQGGSEKTLVCKMA
jgi:hypothetical protein